jgi:iron complex transport system substrate-binding protein
VRAGAEARGPRHPHLARRVRLPSALAASAAIAVLGLTISGAPAAAGRRAPFQGVTTAGRPLQSALFPVTIDTAAGRITIAHRPTRVVSLSPTATEDLFAIGAGHQVIAVDDDSDYPKDAPRTSLSGYTPNVEAIAHYRPDLVVISDDTALVQSLGKLGIPVLYQPAAANLAGAYAEIDQLGTATGDLAPANALVTSMRTKVRKLVAAAPHFRQAPTYFYELSANPFYSATSSSFIGSVLSLFHLRDIADVAKDAGSGYPELSEEYNVKADPQLIFLADTGIDGGQTPATVAKRPGWSGIAAVTDHDVVVLNADIASRWGPRIVDLIANVEQALWTYKHQSP